MQLTRSFDKKAVNLQRTGRLGTFPSSLGQEGWFVGLGMALDANDIYCPYYRDQGALFARGADMARMLCYWGGITKGNNLLTTNSDMPLSVPIASQATYACGLAFANKYLGKNNIVLCSLGDGATSKGEFYEAMNMAKIHNLAIIFAINNNQYAISTHINQQSAMSDLSKKGLSFGIEGTKIDGQDAILVYETVIELKKKCLTDGPQLLTGKTFRMSDHTTADDAKRYIQDNYVKTGNEKDPIKALAKSIPQNKLIELDEKIKHNIESAVMEYFNSYELENAFEHVFGNNPKEIMQQSKTWKQKHEL